MAQPNNFGVASAQFYDQNDTKDFNSLSSREYLEILNKELLGALKEELEEAKLRCEDEEDDTSLGEYMGLKAAIDRIERFLSESPSKVYTTGKKFSLDDRSYLYQYYYGNSWGTTTGRSNTFGAINP